MPQDWTYGTYLVVYLSARINKRRHTYDYRYPAIDAALSVLSLMGRESVRLYLFRTLVFEVPGATRTGDGAGCTLGHAREDAGEDARVYQVSERFELMACNWFLDPPSTSTWSTTGAVSEVGRGAQLSLFLDILRFLLDCCGSFSGTGIDVNQRRQPLQPYYRRRIHR